MISRGITHWTTNDLNLHNDPPFDVIFLILEIDCFLGEDTFSYLFTRLKNNTLSHKLMHFMNIRLCL